MQEALLGAVAGFVVCWALLVVCIRRSYRQRMADEQLNAPLLGECVVCVCIAVVRMHCIAARKLLTTLALCLAAARTNTAWTLRFGAHNHRVVAGVVHSICCARAWLLR